MMSVDVRVCVCVCVRVCYISLSRAVIENWDRFVGWESVLNKQVYNQCANSTFISKLWCNIMLHFPSLITGILQNIIKLKKVVFFRSVRVHVLNLFVL